ncbi:MAG: hypothetical protein J0H15_13785 [Xanthomonadales bacterium]|nr:hypothetical protein [Xanthomonadales bacterium]
MTLQPFLIALYGFAALCALLALAHAAAARRRWRTRRRFAAGHRGLWSLVFLLLAGIGALAGTALLGWHRLTAEEPVAEVSTRLATPGRYSVVVSTPDGARHEAELAGDEWQLDARVIKWDSRAVLLGAPPLYRLDRISGRYRDVARETAAPRSVVALSPAPALDLWRLKREFPDWLPWVDADYGSAAYLPLVDGGRFVVTLAAGGGLVARPADAASEALLRRSGW